MFRLWRERVRTIRKATIEYTNKVAKIDGVDAALVVVPYYNKPDQAGMIAHFTAVADNVDLPIVMYNIPGRTGVTMEVKTIAELSKHQNIIGIKDCTGIVNMAEIVANTPDDFLAFTGEDCLMPWLPETLAHKALFPLQVICSEKKSVRCMPQIQRVTTKLPAS